MLKISDAQPKDSSLIYSYIKALADEEEFPYSVEVTEDDVLNNLLSENSVASCLLIEFDGTACGFAVYYFTFATTQGKKGIHLDDFYIDPQFRRLGIGKKVMSHIAKIGEANDCTRFEWWVLKNNHSAIEFYNSLGAIDLEELSVFRLNKSDINKLAEGTA